MGRTKFKKERKNDTGLVLSENTKKISILDLSKEIKVKIPIDTVMLQLGIVSIDLIEFHKVLGIAINVPLLEHLTVEFGKEVTDKIITLL